VDQEIAVGRAHIALVAILEVVVRHLDSVVKAALDGLDRRPVPVLTQVLVAFAGVQQHLSDLGLHQPTTRGHGTEPKCRLIQTVIPLTFPRDGELSLEFVQRPLCISSAALF